MASKTKLNGFALFMREKRRQLESEGLTFPGGWKDVAIHVDKDWKNLSNDAREFYRQRAQEVNGEAVSQPRAPAQSGTGDFRKTSLGFTFQELKDIEQAKRKHFMDHHVELKRMLEHGDPKEVTFIIVNFSIYGQLLHKVFVPAEIGLTAFNVKGGILDNYSSLIDPYEIPLGMGIEARQAVERLAVPYPPFDNRLQKFGDIVSIIEAFLDRHLHPKIRKRKLYCLNGEMQVNQGCLDWLYRQVPGKKNDIQIYSLGEAMRMLSSVGVTNRARQENKISRDVVDKIATERLKREQDSGSGSGYSFSSGYVMGSTTTDYSTLSSTSVSSLDVGKSGNRMGYTDLINTKARVFYHEKQVEEFLGSFDLAFDGEIGCLYHLNKDEGLQFCALNITNRYAYNLLDAMITTYGVIPRPMRHVPAIRVNPKEEAERRAELLGFWGILVYSDDDFSYDIRKRDPKAVTIYPNMGPNRPE